MKKKIYLISYAVIQFFVSVYSFVLASSIAQKQLDSLMKTINMMPTGLQATMKEMYTLESMTSSVKLLAFIGAILAIILLVLFLKDKVSEKKTLAIVLTAVSIFVASNAIVTLLAGVALVLIAKTPKKMTEKKEKKKLEKLERLDVSGKDVILTIVLIALYLTQFFIGDFISDPKLIVIVGIAYYILVFVFSCFVFRKRLKRDYAAYKSNVGAHVGQAFKWWGILIGCSYLMVIVRLALGGEMVTANQSDLNEMPLWYTAPLAIIWAPFVEEIIFRGCIRRFIKNDVAFIIVAGLTFGLGHTITSESGLYNIIVQSLQYVAMGVVMATAYVKTNNIFVNMSIHCIQNTLATFLMAFM